MPKVGIHAIIENEKCQVLLVQKSYLDRDWVPPGGLMEEGESIPAAITREVREETGYSIAVEKLIAVASRPQSNDVILVVKSRILAREIVEIDPNEIVQIGFFSLNELPKPMKPEVVQLFALYQSGAMGQLITI